MKKIVREIGRMMEELLMMVRGVTVV